MTEALASPAPSPGVGGFSRGGPAAALGRVPAPALFVAGALSQYLGAALAVGLFEVLPAAGVGWLRIVGAAGIMVAWRRPWRVAWTRQRLLLAGAFGTALAAMNLCFYLAVDLLPLGTTVAIEFLGPIAVAALGTRGRRDALALALAVAGVALLADVQLEGNPLGVGFALAAAACWAAYILLGSRVSAQGDGVDGLAAGMALGALATAPFAAPAGLPAFADAGLLAACLGVGVLSSAIPYALDQLVLRRTTAARFALLLALLPATAAVVGLVVLRQVPTPLEAVGISLVVTAVAARSRPA